MKYGLEFTGVKKRARRDWGATVLTGLTLLALAALCGWLWSCVRDAQSLRLGDFETGRLVAMATPGAPVVVGITAVVMVLLFWWALTSVMRNQDEMDAEWEKRRAKERDPQIAPIPNRFSETESCLESAASADGLPPEELRRIVGALIVETCQARECVRKAQRDLSVEDYGAKLAAAEASLHLCIGCLGGLLDRCGPQIGGRIPSRFSESEIMIPSAESADDQGREA